MNYNDVKLSTCYVVAGAYAAPYTMALGWVTSCMNGLSEALDVQLCGVALGCGVLCVIQSVEIFPFSILFDLFMLPTMW